MCSLAPVSTPPTKPAILGYKEEGTQAARHSALAGPAPSLTRLVALAGPIQQQRQAAVGRGSVCPAALGSRGLRRVEDHSVVDGKLAERRHGLTDPMEDLSQLVEEGQGVRRSCRESSQWSVRRPASPLSPRGRDRVGAPPPSQQQRISSPPGHGLWDVFTSWITATLGFLRKRSTCTTLRSNFLIYKKPGR